MGAYFVFIHRDVNTGMRRPRGRRIGLGLGLGLVTDTEYVTMYEKNMRTGHQRVKDRVRPADTVTGF